MLKYTGIPKTDAKLIRKYGVDKSGNDVTVVDWGNLLPKDKYKLVIDSDKQGFRFEFVDPITEDDQFVIEYRVKLTPPFLLRNGEKALNTATIYTDNNIGGGDPAYSTAEVVYNLSNASAGGYAYKLHLRKVEA